MTKSAGKKRRTATQLAAEGFAALVEKLGMADAIRYVQLHEPGEGDYARQRHEWLGTLNADDLPTLLKSANRRKAARKH